MGGVLFENGRVYEGGRFTARDLLVQDGIVAPAGAPVPPDCERVDLAGRMLAPGFLAAWT